MDFYGTLGPACLETDIIRKMFECGMTGMRLNLSHTGLKEAAGMIRIFRRGAEEACVSSPDLLIDMQGPELRIGSLIEPLKLVSGENIRLGRDIPVPVSIFPLLEPGLKIQLDDGKILLEVCDPAADSGSCRILRGGKLEGKKSLSLIGKENAGPALTAQDRQNLKDAAEFGVTGIMQPFVRTREDLLEVRRVMEETGCGHLKLLAKIENAEGVESISQFMDLADQIVIARGDLGNSMPLWKLPGIQKSLSGICRRAGKPFMVVTQLLASMESRPVPTRAEVSDIYNAVLDGAASLMVTGETAAGFYPVEVIRYLVNTANEAIENVI